MGLGFSAICIMRFTEIGAGLPVEYTTVGFLVGGASFVSVSLLTGRSSPVASG